MEKMTDEQILDFEFESMELGKTTMREYLNALITRLWGQGEGFSGERPFGNSGWEYDLYKPLVMCGAVKGELDEEGYLADFDKTKADKKVFQLIDFMCGLK